MRLDNNDIRALPLHMQEQVGVSLVAQISRENMRKGLGIDPAANQKVHVRILQFKNKQAARRYLALREADRNGLLSELVLHMNEKYRVHKFTYTKTEEF